MREATREELIAAAEITKAGTAVLLESGVSVDGSTIQKRLGFVYAIGRCGECPLGSGDLPKCIAFYKQFCEGMRQ